MFYDTTTLACKIGFVLGRLTWAWENTDDAMISCIFAGNGVGPTSLAFVLRDGLYISESIIDSTAEMRTLVCPL